MLHPPIPRPSVLLATFNDVSLALLAVFALPIAALVTGVLSTTGPLPVPQRRQRALMATSVAGVVVSITNLLIAAWLLRVAELAAAALLLGLVLSLTPGYLPGPPSGLTLPGPAWAWTVGAALLAVAGIALIWQLTNSPSTSANGYARHRYEIYGTCTSRHCGLNERPQPDNALKPVGIRHREGVVVTVLCQTLGTEVSDPPDQHSQVWDMLDDGHWVSDLYVRTPRSALGRLSPQIDRCRR